MALVVQCLEQSTALWSHRRRCHNSLLCLRDGGGVEGGLLYCRDAIIREIDARRPCSRHACCCSFVTLLDYVVALGVVTALGRGVVHGGQ